MNAKTKIDFYSNKKSKIDLKGYYTEDHELCKKLDELYIDLNNGFTLFSRKNLERFLLGHKDIADFAEQFVKLHFYYKTNNKYSNTEEQYCILYGESLGKQRWQEKINKVKGKNNPWYNHGGKYSPFKKGSVNYNIEVTKKAAENREYNTRIEYYLNRGYTQEESEFLLKERQTTFSLEKCILKYGEELGIEVFKNRQEKWQNTLKSKSQEEIDEINKKKSSGIGRYLDRNIPGHLYYIHFSTDAIDFWKIGITSKHVAERFNMDILEFKHHIYAEVLFFEEYNSIQEAYEAEQFILAKFSNNRVIVDIPGFYSTECFNIDILKGFYDEII